MYILATPTKLKNEEKMKILIKSRKLKTNI